MATECAGDQGAWWQFHDAYLIRPLARSFTRAGAIDLARDHQLDVDRFTTCLDDEEHADRILRMQQQAIAEGVNSTPTFRINGRPGGRSVNAMLDQVRAAAEAANTEEDGS